MNDTGLIIAIFISVIFIINTLISCFSPIGDFDGGSVGGDGFDIGDYFSFKGFLHFVFGFSWSWAVWGINTFNTALLAVGIGIICVVALALLYKFLFKLEAPEHEKEPLSNLKGKTGTIYSIVDVNPDNTNKAYLGNIIYNNEYQQLLMSSKDSFKTGDQFIVKNVINDYIEISKIDY